ncbi:MAG: class I SAM-dependent methyltransferase [Bacteroidota bacterium]
MKKIEQNFILNQYRSGIQSYTDFTKDVGLWASEKYVFEKYLKPSDRILDLGCGTGRTTFPLYQLSYENIRGVDLTPEMIESAKALDTHFELDINFQVGDATNLALEDSHFNAVIFSFNGIMSIPSQTNRNQALQEIHRVLKKDGIFIFTTHDRDKEEEYLTFWKEEKARWEAKEQNPRLYEFGDLITDSKNENSEIFIHIPNQAEVENWLMNHGFEVLETFYRSDRFEESEAVKAKSGECRFWVAKKI